MMTIESSDGSARKQIVPLRLLNTEKSAPALLRKRIIGLTKFFGAPNLKLYCAGRLLTDEMLANLQANATILVGQDPLSGPLLGGAEGGAGGKLGGAGGDVALEDIYAKFAVITSHGGETGLAFTPSEEYKNENPPVVLRSENLDALTF